MEQELKVRIRNDAIEMALSHKFDFSNLSEMDIPETFGGKWKDGVTRKRDSLKLKYKHQFSSLLSLANRFYIFSCHYSSASMAVHFKYYFKCEILQEREAMLATPDGYANIEGWANTLHEQLSEMNKPMQLANYEGFAEFPKEEDLLFAIAICWFVDAALISTGDSKKSHDILFEVSEAMSHADGIMIWNGAEEFQRELLRNAGKAGAELRHENMKKLRDWAVGKYKEREWKSANSAAYTLLPEILEKSKTLGANIAPSNAQRTAAEWFRKSV